MCSKQKKIFQKTCRVENNIVPLQQINQVLTYKEGRNEQDIE